MKKIFVVLVLLILFSLLFLPLNTSLADNNPTGRWAEKISERVVMDIIPDKNNNEYQIFITWREDNLAQKDIYRFNAIKDKDGNLAYKNGVHISRSYNPDKTYKDELNYSDGSGLIQVNENELVWIDNKNKKENTAFIPANKDLTKDTTIKNKFLSITLPEELKGFYEVEVKKNRIIIYDKASKEAGFGGYAFGILLYKNPSEHAMMPGGKKIGELVTRFGKIYDVVLSQPTDVQYDYVNGSSESYKILYALGEKINITGIGKNKFVKDQGMKGEDLYKDVLKKHITAIKEEWDSTKLEQENMSYMYNIIRDTNKNILDKIGYAYYDVNGDGIEELIIGEIADGDWKGVIYDMYTMVNRKPIHVISGGSRNRYFACNDIFVCNEYSSGANESGWRIYILVENSTELYPQLGFKYDGYENTSSPWFISYDFVNDKWINVTENTFKERKSVFDRYKRFDYTPLSKFDSEN